jgi:hypothetical protein
MDNPNELNEETARFRAKMSSIENGGVCIACSLQELTGKPVPPGFWHLLPPRTKTNAMALAARVIMAAEDVAPRLMEEAPKDATIQIWTVNKRWVRCRWDADLAAWVGDDGHRLGVFDALCWRPEYPAPSEGRLRELST